MKGSLEWASGDSWPAYPLGSRWQLGEWVGVPEVDFIAWLHCRET